MRSYEYILDIDKHDIDFINKIVEAYEGLAIVRTLDSKNGKIKFLPSISALAKRFEVTRPALSREISNLCKKNILTKSENNAYLVNFSNFSEKNI